MTRPAKVALLHELHYELRLETAYGDRYVDLQTKHDALADELAEEYRCSRADLLATIREDFTLWRKEEGLPWASSKKSD